MTELDFKISLSTKKFGLGFFYEKNSTGNTIVHKLHFQLTWIDAQFIILLRKRMNWIK